MFFNVLGNTEEMLPIPFQILYHCLHTLGWNALQPSKAGEMPH